MRRFIPLVLIVLVIAACTASDGDDEAIAAETTAADTSAPETTAAETTTTTTTEAPTTTTGASTPDEPGNGGAAFEPLPGTPPAVFDSFVSTLTVSMGFDDAAIEVTGEGTWAGDVFECSVTMSIGGLGLSQAVIATPDTLWLDTGSGFEEAGLFGPAQDVVSTCPASPLFWGDFTAEDFGRAVGDTEDFAGRQAVKLDLTEVLGLAGGMGMIPDIEDAVINSMVMWVDEETNVVLGLFADVELDSAALGDFGVPGSEPADAVAMVMELRVEQVNDPTLDVAIPG
ncbi:MAG: hypothetical protein QNJ77_15460 [Acidimicrobiia bacterium]|nr:hypothetical protein [Acidimicrobiia bacterium]